MNRFRAAVVLCFCCVYLWSQAAAAQQPERRIEVRQQPLPPSDPAHVEWTDGEKPFVEGADGRKLASALTDYFKSEPQQRSNFVFAAELDAVLRERPATVRKLAWAAYRQGWERQCCKDDLAGFKVTWKNLTMPYVMHQVGTRPRAIAPS